MAYDREYAFRFMVPAKTEKVRDLNDELQFFTEQQYKEVRRVITENYAVQR